MDPKELRKFLNEEPHFDKPKHVEKTHWWNNMPKSFPIPSGRQSPTPSEQHNMSGRQSPSPSEKLYMSGRQSPTLSEYSNTSPVGSVEHPSAFPSSMNQRTPDPTNDARFNPFSD